MFWANALIVAPISSPVVVATQSMSDSDSEGKAAAAPETTDLRNPDVVAKYKLAAQITNQVRIRRNGRVMVLSPNRISRRSGATRGFSVILPLHHIA